MGRRPTASPARSNSSPPSVMRSRRPSAPTTSSRGASRLRPCAGCCRGRASRSSRRAPMGPPTMGGRVAQAGGCDGHRHGRAHPGRRRSGSGRPTPSAHRHAAARRRPAARGVRHGEPARGAARRDPHRAGRQGPGHGRAGRGGAQRAHRGGLHRGGTPPALRASCSCSPAARSPGRRGRRRGGHHPDGRPARPRGGGAVLAGAAARPTSPARSASRGPTPPSRRRCPPSTMCRPAQARSAPCWRCASRSTGARAATAADPPARRRRLAPHLTTTLQPARRKTLGPQRRTWTLLELTVSVP